jgi:hypothetical protein
MQAEIDILENDLLERFPEVLELMLHDHTTKQNIFWATDNYKDRGNDYQFSSQIKLEYITGKNGNIIMPRVKKDKILQQLRVKGMAEVFTPSWVCNDQNNAVDGCYFGKDSVFNKRIIKINGNVSWQVNFNKIEFPQGTTWIDYVKRKSLEITCGEAPYLASRYDATTGKYIPLKYRIGLLDRKYRVINENVNDQQQWLDAAEKAHKSIYGFEWQGDSLLLAREAILYTFIENFIEKFNYEPTLVDIKKIAYIISWNIWQMDGLKAVIPNSCNPENESSENLFGDITDKIVECKGCKLRKKHLHNGIYCKIMDWNQIDSSTGNLGLVTRFVDLIEK